MGAKWTISAPGRLAGKGVVTMPHAALRTCSYPGGCSNLVKSGRCDQHPYPDAHIREHQKLYDDPRWERRRKLQLSEHPWCELWCKEKGIYTPATVADHVEPHRGDPVKFFTGKLQSACKICHDRKTAKEVLNG